VKYSKANTLQTQQFIARYGKAARYPVCQAAIRLWSVRDEIRKYAQEAPSLGGLLNSVKQQREQARELHEQIYKEGKQKETIEAAALVVEMDDLFKKTNSAFEANAKLFGIFSEVLLPVAVAQFESECDAVIRTKDTKAIQAFERVKKRWRDDPSGKGARLRAGDQRELEILNMHRDKVIKAARGTKDGIGVGYLEAVRGGHRLLSDDVWQERFTVKEMYSYLLATHGPRVAGDKDGKAIRRTLGSLGIRPAEDQLGRKWKPPFSKPKTKLPVGRPRTNPDLEYRSDIEAFGVLPAIDLDKPLTATGLVEEGDPEVREAQQVVEGSEFTESDQLVESNRFNEAHQLFVPDWLKGGNANHAQRAAPKRFRENGLWDKYEARLSRELNKVYLPPNPADWRLPLTAEQRARVPYFASFQELKRWMDNNRRAALPCLVGSFTRIKALKQWLRRKEASASLLFWSQWLSCSKNRSYKKCTNYWGYFGDICGYYTSTPRQGGANAYPQRAFRPLATIN